VTIAESIESREVPTRAAERARRARDRRKRGCFVFQIEISPASVDKLIEVGRLEPAKRHDKAAVGQALQKAVPELDWRVW